MSSDLYIGIALGNDVLEIAALGPGKAAVAMKFPAMGMGLERIRGFLSCSGNYSIFTPIKQ
ncbi:MAG: hypothetical protein WBP37_16145 [Candidatus Dechloromonas phosphoritropha]